MSKIITFAGLPGAGKTTLAAKLAAGTDGLHIKEWRNTEENLAKLREESIKPLGQADLDFIIKCELDYISGNALILEYVVKDNQKIYFADFDLQASIAFTAAFAESRDILYIQKVLSNKINNCVYDNHRDDITPILVPIHPQIALNRQKERGKDGEHGWGYDWLCRYAEHLDALYKTKEKGII